MKNPEHMRARIAAFMLELAHHPEVLDARECMLQIEEDARRLAAGMKWEFSLPPITPDIQEFLDKT